jgi:phenylalanyl-tRNA synthetase alpha chain
VSQPLGQIPEIVSEIKTMISSAATLEDLRAEKSSIVGDKSQLAKISQGLGKLDGQERALVGKAVGQARAEIAQLFEARYLELEKERDQRVINEERVDVTLPTHRRPSGGLHPLTLINNEIAEIFTSIGYRTVEGPELEASWLNFDALNIPADHPARTMQDTFFIDPLDSNLVLRTHTSPSQIRTMLSEQPPIYVICPGRTYRSDELDATHTPVFSQVEGLVIDRGISMSHLKGTLDFFAKEMFGAEVITRLRPSFFPFTEPSAEVDIFFNGRWIEWGGCGMVNPEVLKTCGVDIKEFSGFAFGMGLERTLMVRHNIADIREIVEGDIRFSKKFGMGGR